LPSLPRAQEPTHGQFAGTKGAANQPGEVSFGAQATALSLMQEQAVRSTTKEVQRLSRDEGLRVPQRRRRKRLGASTAPNPPTADAPNVVWAVDFQFDATTDGRPIKAATVLDRPLHLIGAADERSGDRDPSRLLADASLTSNTPPESSRSPLLGRPGKEASPSSPRMRGTSFWAVGAMAQRRTRSGSVCGRGRSSGAPTVLVRRSLRLSGIAPAASLTRFTWSIEQSRIGI
jgi:hypothetical protein